MGTTVQLERRSVFRTDTEYMAWRSVAPPNSIFERTPIGVAAMANQRVDAVEIVDDGMFLGNLRAIANLAAPPARPVNFSTWP